MSLLKARSYFLWNSFRNEKDLPNSLQEVILLCWLKKCTRLLKVLKNLHSWRCWMKSVPLSKGTVTCCIKVWTRVINELISSVEITYLLYQWDNPQMWLAWLYCMFWSIISPEWWNPEDLCRGTPGNEHQELNNFFWQQTCCLARNTRCWITFLRLMAYPGTGLLTFAPVIQKPRWGKLLAP